MPLNIRNRQAEELATLLAKLTGETKTDAVTQALKERVERVRRKTSRTPETDGIALEPSQVPYE